jgi:hypothetical protein
MLDYERSKMLEERVLKMLDIESQPESIRKTILKFATQAAIVTLQEYEHMQNEGD